MTAGFSNVAMKNRGLFQTYLQHEINLLTRLLEAYWTLKLAQLVRLSVLGKLEKFMSVVCLISSCDKNEARLATCA